jgi:hypothetical protein
MSADDPSKNSKITARTFAEKCLLVFFSLHFITIKQGSS